MTMDLRMISIALFGAYYLSAREHADEDSRHDMHLAHDFHVSGIWSNIWLDCIPASQATGPACRLSLMCDCQVPDSTAVRRTPGDADNAIVSQDGLLVLLRPDAWLQEGLQQVSSG